MGFEFKCGGRGFSLKTVLNVRFIYLGKPLVLRLSVRVSGFAHEVIGARSDDPMRLSLKEGVASCA